MIEVIGNLWTYHLPDGSEPDIRVITTNGTVKRNGECVMGRGCALEAKSRYPDLAFMLGQVIQGLGNEAFWIMTKDGPIITFPVKHNWYEKADLSLIEKSALKIASMHALEDKTVVMPRPGCGNGRLDWELNVKPILAPILDDRFHVITFK
jgi:hypothetical protein